MTEEQVRELAQRSGLALFPGWINYGKGFRNLRMFANLVRNLALEDAATICREEGEEWESDKQVTDKNYATYCANRIRTLKE